MYVKAVFHDNVGRIVLPCVLFDAFVLTSISLPVGAFIGTGRYAGNCSRAAA